MERIIMSAIPKWVLHKKQEKKWRDEESTHAPLAFLTNQMRSSKRKLRFAGPTLTLLKKLELKLQQPSFINCSSRRRWLANERQMQSPPLLPAVASRSWICSVTTHTTGLQLVKDYKPQRVLVPRGTHPIWTIQLILLMRRRKSRESRRLEWLIHPFSYIGLVGFSKANVVIVMGMILTINCTWESLISSIVCDQSFT